MNQNKQRIEVWFYPDEVKRIEQAAFNSRKTRKYFCEDAVLEAVKKILKAPKK